MQHFNIHYIYPTEYGVGNFNKIIFASSEERAIEIFFSNEAYIAGTITKVEQYVSAPVQ
jgi:hypothetical protein